MNPTALAVGEKKHISYLTITNSLKTKDLTKELFEIPKKYSVDL